eukprot:710310-Pleurochrysis_carterae.AAC.1
MRTYHTVQGALILNEQAKWCELCAWAHGKECERLRAYRTEEARRTQELMAKARRETEPTRAQQQAARPEYTLSVEKEKQVRNVENTEGKVEGEREKAPAQEPYVKLCYAGAGGKGALGVRGVGEGSRRSTRTTTSGTGRGQIANGLQGLQTAPRELPFCTTQVQIFPLQPPAERDARQAQGFRIGRGEERTHADVAARGQRKGMVRSGTQRSGGEREQERVRPERMVVGKKGREERAPRGRGGGEKEKDGDHRRRNRTKRAIADQAAAETSGVHATINGQKVPFDMTCAIPSTIQGAISMNGTCEILLVRNNLSCCGETECTTSAFYMQSVTRYGKHMEGTDGMKGQTLLPLVFVCA